MRCDVRSSLALRYEKLGGKDKVFRTKGWPNPFSPGPAVRDAERFALE